MGAERENKVPMLIVQYVHILIREQKINCFENAPTTPEMVPIAHHRYVIICAAILPPVKKLEVTKS